jgi:hypothetical protein
VTVTFSATARRLGHARRAGDLQVDRAAGADRAGDVRTRAVAGVPAVERGERGQPDRAAGREVADQVADEMDVAGVVEQAERTAGAESADDEVRHRLAGHGVQVRGERSRRAGRPRRHERRDGRVDGRQVHGDRDRVGRDVGTTSEHDVPLLALSERSRATTGAIASVEDAPG